jgi:translation initiation factor IF-2
MDALGPFRLRCARNVLVKREIGEHLPEAELDVPADELEVELLPVVEIVPEPEPVPEPVVEVVPEPEPEPEPEPVVVEAPIEPEVDQPVAKPAPVILDRAAIIGEKELKAREAESRRYTTLREIQERELREKQAKEAELVRMRQQAEAASAAAKVAEQAKQQVVAAAKSAEGCASARRQGYDPAQKAGCRWQKGRQRSRRR